MLSNSPRGTLCIWTDVAPEHDADFNAWYDREHMQERIAIPGFLYARRFKSITPSARPYLALYVTESLATFDSPAYRSAFAHQTAWSLANFERMTNTQRRVCEAAVACGEGEGGVISIFVVPEHQVDMPQLDKALHAAMSERGITSAQVMSTQPSHSVSLTQKDAALPPADALVIIEGQSAISTEKAAHAIAIPLDIQRVSTFALLWRLASSHANGV